MDHWLITLCTGIAALLNIGALAYLLSWAFGKVDKHNDLLPKISSQLDASIQTQKIILSSVEELFNGRNNHEVRLGKIETTIELNGCNTVKTKRNLSDPVDYN